MVTEEEWSGEVAIEALPPTQPGHRPRCVRADLPAVHDGPQRDPSGFNGYLVSVGLIVAVMLPLAFGLVVLGERRQRLTDEKVRRLNDELSEAIAAADREAVIRDSQVQRQRFESRLANALDMAEVSPR